MNVWSKSENEVSLLQVVFPSILNFSYHFAILRRILLTVSRKIILNEYDKKNSRFFKLAK